jgi:hypothetical protein
MNEAPIVEAFSTAGLLVHAFEHHDQQRADMIAEAVRDDPDFAVSLCYALASLLAGEGL